MTRTIKFRIPMFTDKGHFTEFQYLKLGDDIEGTLCGYNGEPQQFTGLLDKNGKEIYEGDVVEFTYESFATSNAKSRKVVKWEVAENNNEWCRNYGYSLCGQEIEIIGNIYQNPELITN